MKTSAPLIQSNISLKPFNSFGIDVKAKEFVVIESTSQMQDLIPRIQNQPYLIVGGGSNVLFVNDFQGLVILNQIRGKELVSSNESNFLVSGSSGEQWHDFVLWNLSQGYNGLENLSLIPGTVGASPLQNIGAYGVELKDVCHSVEAMNLHTGDIRIFSNKECEFGYRESVFKRSLKGKFFITKVLFNLASNSPLHTNYGSIQDELIQKGITSPNHKDISDAVIRIRSSKLPNPKELGNAGSFFKNPIVSIHTADQLKNQYPEMPRFTEQDGFKIPAGWLIEKAGFKGKIIGNVGSHKDQALVIVNYGAASGKEIYDYSSLIIESIKAQFGIELEREVNIIF